jgi:hypothetical protein
MIASIALEHRGVPMDQAAQVSIARFSNTGPEAFFMLLLARDSMEWSLRLLTALLIITSLASQFTSTLLLSDMISEQVASLAENVTVQYDYPDHQNHSPYHDPSQFETFAEYSEDGMKSEGVDDTGTVLRAFLPIAQQHTRQSLRKYEGLSYVYDAHVLCVRPEFEEMRFCNLATDKGKYSRVCGVTKPEPGLLDSLNVMGDLTRMNFTCLIIAGVSPCWLDLQGMTPINDVLYPLSYKKRLSYTMHAGNTYLLWDNPQNVIERCYNATNGAKWCRTRTGDILSLDKSGPWLQAAGALANGSVLLFNASLCFDSV